MSENDNDVGGVDEGSGNVIGDLREVFDELFQLVAEEPIILVFLVALVGGALLIYKKIDKRANEDFTETDWSKTIPEDIKYIVNSVGFEAGKELLRGEFNKIGNVHKYDIQSMPENKEFSDLILRSEDEDEDDTEWHDVYVLLVAPSYGISNWIWKITDLYFSGNSRTKIYIVDSESIEEESGRFKLDENIQFKNEYGNIFVEKGTATENATDQFPIYQARKKTVEGIEEFVQKTLFFDRGYGQKIGELREDVDEEALKRLLDEGSNF